mgnify:CR=1 FL=1
MSLVQTQNLTKVYGSGSTAVTALERVNINIHDGEFVAIMGPSGCGKSTLLHLLGGLDTPSDGKIFIDGASIAEMTDDKLTEMRRRRIGFVFQFFNLIPVLSAAENAEPSLILADEPTGNLDTRSGDEIAGLLRDVSKQYQRTIIMVTHDPRIAAYSDRIIFLKDGKVVDETLLERKNTRREQMVADKVKEVGD